MNNHVIAMAMCLALQPVIALGAETIVKLGVKEQDNNQSFEIQRGASSKPDRAGINARHGVEPEDRAARQNSSQRAADGVRSVVEPEDRSKKITGPERRPNGSSPYVTSSLGQSVSGRKQSDVAKSCIPMHPENQNGVVQGQKQDNSRNDCEPMTEPRARPDGSRLVQTFPDGARLYAVSRNGAIQKYSAVDQRGRAIKLTLVQNPPKDIALLPGNAIEYGQQRADQERGRRRAKLDDAINKGIEQTAAKKCIVKFETVDGGIGYWDLAASGMGCPKGA